MDAYLDFTALYKVHINLTIFIPKIDSFECTREVFAILESYFHSYTCYDAWGVWNRGKRCDGQIFFANCTEDEAKTFILEKAESIKTLLQQECLFVTMQRAEPYLI